ncbi:MAG: DNA-directed RNA polymerase subunit beta [Patescibacteria group bacterium]
MVGSKEKKTFGAFRLPRAPLPNLVQHQTDSFNRFLEEGIKNLLNEFSPLEDYSGKKFTLSFDDIKITHPDHNEYFAKEHRLSYECSIKVNATLTNKNTGMSKTQELFLLDLPIMTDYGTFIVNGIEKVIIPQLARSFGVFFTVDETKTKQLFGAKIIPARGSWLEFESDLNDAIYVKIDRKRKIAVTSLLRVFGAGSNEDILKLFKSDDAKRFIEASLAKDSAHDTDSSYVEIYKRLRDGEVVASVHAKEFIETLFFGVERYDLSEMGRVRFNSRFGKKMPKKYTQAEQILSLDDLVTIVEKIVELNTIPGSMPDDIDNLGSRRLRFFDEMIAQKFRLGLLQMKRNIQDRMSISDSEAIDPSSFVNPRPLQARIKEFYNTNQLCQFAEQENILMELEKLRTVSALGPGGLVRERAGFEVRDVHPSHYGRLCPIQTPEGQNIGLILRMSSYATVNRFGIIETPYAVVKDGKITDKIHYLDAYAEAEANIAHSAVACDKDGNLTQDTIEVRNQGDPRVVSREEVEFVDVSAYQPFSIATAMIPFVNHNEANRALMGSNMQKQAVPCLKPEAPIIATGIEEDAARYTGRLVYAKEAGTVTVANADKIVVKGSKREIEYSLINFAGTNASSNFHQRPVVNVGDKVKQGALLADTSSSDNGQIAVGQNILTAFMSFYGANFEDAIVVSERLVKHARFTNIHIEEAVMEVRDTKLGPEQTTHDIPNVSEAKLRFLDEDGIIRVGAEVEKGDILVGKITPKGESQLTPEERLLRSIFGEKARDVKDTSLRYKGGTKARVIGVRIFDRAQGEISESGVIRKIYIQLAEMRNINVGDKLAGRHGNKGVVSKILPEEDMPYMEDGTPIDIILTPLGVPSRMNLGQILELHLGLAAHTLDYQAIVPPFSGATDEEIKAELTKAGFKDSGKVPLMDGRTGEFFAQDIAVGYMYILKLHHMVEDKIHMRSVGPYSLINQQPLGGKSNEGGQRFGEMEVWALLGHGAAYTLREMLTVKSDDIIGRSAMYEAIIKGRNTVLPNLPESFNVMTYNLKGLALDIELLEEGEHAN